MSTQGRPLIIGHSHAGALFEAAAQRRTLALWRLALELQREVCTDLAIALRPPPRGTVDDDGYLLPTYSHDLAHANAAYGRAVLADLGLLEEGPRV